MEKSMLVIFLLLQGTIFILYFSGFSYWGRKVDDPISAHASFSYHLSSSGKHLKFTPSFDLNLFLSSHKKNLGFDPNKLNMRPLWELRWRIKWTHLEYKFFTQKGIFNLKVTIFHKANTFRYGKRNLKLKNRHFSILKQPWPLLERGLNY